jgi:hypothetical protein
MRKKVEQLFCSHEFEEVSSKIIENRYREECTKCGKTREEKLLD